jgi:hypothetical protein
MRKSIGVYLALLAIVAISSLVLSKGGRPFPLWGTNPNFERIRWDTGYGFNEAQAGFGGVITGQKTDDRGMLIYRLMEFPPAVRVFKVEICHQNPVRLFFEENGFHEILPAENKEGCSIFALPEGPQVAGREGFAQWSLFSIGSILGALILFTWLQFFRSCRVNPEPGQANERPFLYLGAAVLVAAAAAAFVFYPGFVNPFDPLSIVRHGFNPYYSLLLQVFWLSFLEIFPRSVPHPFVFCFPQLLAFLAALMFLIRALFRKHTISVPLLFIFVFAIAFNPASLFAHFLPTRGIAAGCLNFLFWGWLLLLLLDGNRPTLRRTIAFSFLAAAMVSIRLDNLLYFPFAVFLLIWKGFPSKRIALLIGIVAAVFLLQIPLEKASDPQDWRKNYSETSLGLILRTFHDFNGPLKGCGWSAGDRKADPQLLLRCISQNLPAFAEYRILIMRRILYAPDLGFHHSVIHDQENIGSILDFGLASLPRAGMLEVRPYSLLKFNSRYWLSLWQFSIPMLLFFASALFLRSAPCAGAVCLLVSLRVLFVFALCGDARFHYFFDLHLWGLFLPLAVITERRMRRTEKLKA